MINNFKQKKSSGNSKLLTILTNRQRSSSVSSLKPNQWPGKFRPSFAETIRIQTASQISALRHRHKSFGGLKRQYISEVTPVRCTFQGDLVLKPQHQIYEEKRSSLLKSKQSSRKSSRVFKIEEEDSELKRSNIFKNIKISKQVNEVISKKLTLLKIDENIGMAHKSQRQEPSQKTCKREKHIQNNKNYRFTETKGNKNQRENGQAKYKIDFQTFGYIEKVIDNPQLWGKYVHKQHD